MPALDLAQPMERIVVPAPMWSACQIPVTSIIGNDHPVELEGLEDHPDLFRIARDVEGTFQTKALTHRRKVSVVAIGSEMASGIDVVLARSRHGETDRVADRSVLDIVVAHQAGEDR